MRVQTAIDDSKFVQAISQNRQTENDLDYLVARLHGRRSRMAEAERLDNLCRIRNLHEFFRTIFPESDIKEVVGFQRQLIDQMVDEFSRFCSHLSGPGTDLLDWMLVRFQVENLKVLIRACLTKAPLEEFKEYLISLPVKFTVNIQELTKAESPADFVHLVPIRLLQEDLEKALEIYNKYPRSFFFEAALDCGYLKGLIEKTVHLSGEDCAFVKPMVFQEADIFNIMLVARGKFYYGLAPDILRQFYVPGTQISRTQFHSMLDEADLSSSMGRIPHCVFDTDLPQFSREGGSIDVDASVLEGLAWNRFYRLANLAFRQSHMGLAAIVGYTGLRRVELANLIRISEGIRMDIPAETIRAHMIPRIGIEVKHV
ncbi:MAG: V-type ATPase subunit [Syntrophorhabdus sp.]|nr:V-type ATPase subunit [Syntrophorhabdus sp.]